MAIKEGTVNIETCLKQYEIRVTGGGGGRNCEGIGLIKGWLLVDYLDVLDVSQNS